MGQGVDGEAFGVPDVNGMVEIVNSFHAGGP
jgi:hypothetical protein